MSSNFLQPSNTSGGLEDIVKLADLMSNKKDVAKFLESLKEQEATIKKETAKLNEEREKFEKIRGVKTAMEDLTSYKKEAKAKADSIILKAKDDAALILAEAADEEAQINKLYTSFQKQQIDLKASQSSVENYLDSAKKKDDSSARLETKMKKLVSQVNQRIKKVASLLEEIKNV